jgi:hypothetical protein
VSKPKSPGPDWVGLLGVVLSVALHLVLQAKGPNPFFIVGACLFWAGFVALRAWRDRGAFRRWGFRADNLLRASLLPLVVFVVTAAGFAGYAWRRGTLRRPGHLPLLLLLYPAWGVVQQFLALGIVLSSLELVPRVGRHRVVLAIGVAALFACVHFPDVLLMAATFLLELVIVPLYLRHRNLWPLGVLHGWLGALFYLWVLDRDLLVENFG